MTQAKLAALIGVSQSALSQIENAENMEIVTLRRVIESMGGRLSITAEFKEEAILLT
jgi:transcriptional regulator with XRE-family HTH domain